MKKDTLASRQELFLSRFDEGMRPSIVEYGKRITNISGKSDVIIFMARKSACLAESLRILRLANFQCIITSHRVLDMNTSWLKGKHIAIFDDAVITGTTICCTKLVLENLGCIVTVNVLCVDTDNWCPDLVEPSKPYLNLDQQSCASLCSDIVDAISLIPLPYSTDYPCLSPTNIDHDDLNSLLSMPLWSARSVTTNIQADHDIFSQSYEPRFSIENFLGISENIGTHPKI